MNKILIIDDDKTLLYAMKMALQQDNHEIITSDNGSEGLNRYKSENPDLIFLDITMPGKSGLELLNEIRQTDPDIPVIIMTGYGTMHTAIEAEQLEVFEYVNKPLDLEEIRRLTKDALVSSKTRVGSYEEASGAEIEAVSFEIIGASEPIQKVFRQIGRATKTPSSTPILILGESGTGKELVAIALHDKGENNSEPFIPINCAAVPENLLESELFGHVKGAFTGADQEKIGKFEAVGSGTIFLDEIAEMSFPLQAKLLRVIEERKFQKVGSLDNIEIKARFLFATNKNLNKLIKEKKFREDLFYRLNVIAINLPSLDERSGDIPSLAIFFAKRYAHSMKKVIRSISENALEMLNSYSYQGNVRELKNIIERAVVASRGDTLTQKDLSFINVTDNEDLAGDAQKETPEERRDQAVKSFDKTYIEDILQKTSGNISKTAELSGISRPTLYRLIKEYGINLDSFR